MSLLQTIRFITQHPLNRGDEVGSILRFARWQIGTRLIPGEIVCNWIAGSRFLARRGETGITGNIYTGLHEFPDMGFLLHFLRPVDLFVDVGANAGSYSILACSVAGARGIAFEPIPATCRRLVENMRLNHLEERLKCVNKGVGARSGELAFTEGSDTTNHALAPDERSANRTMVDMTTLDIALRSERPSLIKIDVEGYESPVLQGAEAVLKEQSLHAVIMELNGSGQRYGFDETRIRETMSAYGFETFSYSPLDRSLSSLNGRQSDSGNTLFIRDRSFVENRLKTAAKVMVNGRMF